MLLLLTCAVHDRGLCGFESVSDNDSGSSAGRRLRDPKCSESGSSVREGVHLLSDCWLIRVEVSGLWSWSWSLEASVSFGLAWIQIVDGVGWS